MLKLSPFWTGFLYGASADYWWSINLQRETHFLLLRLSFWCCSRLLKGLRQKLNEKHVSLILDSQLSEPISPWCFSYAIVFEYFFSNFCNDMRLIPIHYEDYFYLILSIETKDQGKQATNLFIILLFVIFDNLSPSWYMINIYWTHWINRHSHWRRLLNFREKSHIRNVWPLNEKTKISFYVWLRIFHIKINIVIQQKSSYAECWIRCFCS